MNLSIEQIAIVGFIASVVVRLVVVWVNRLNKPIDRKVITVMLYVPAVIMAYFWARPELPVFPDPVADPALYVSIVLNFIGQLITVAAAVAGAAMTIYNLLLQKVFDAVTWLKK